MSRPTDYSDSGLSFSTMDDSQLLDLSAELPSASNEGDLSLSDLSLDQTIRVPAAPFTLLSKPISRISDEPRTAGIKSSARLADPEEQEQYEEHPRGDEQEDEETSRKRVAKAREEKLQSDLFVLKKLNAAFATFNEALDETGSANQRVAAQLAETDALLNKYVNILSKTEEYARLVFDEGWYGVDADEEQIERERLEEEQRQVQLAQEKELAAQREAEEQERQERERIDREEKERLDHEKRERAATRGGVRGVRGTRASMRGTRAAVPPRPTSSSAVKSRQSVAPGASSSSIPIKRGTARVSTVARGGSTRRPGTS
ncbi:hypothetical protein FA15DRAFT_672009 [Coprinopsis marcescibilis]|uniref:DASH complex subunit DUO1 n=1 Tax=Coprinopsis marcescibilis TaxID=230819 RepID=A0A5C3KNA1_COPMA|nr:hypothetical protein FA15DRAFT_672009 [Coprinopsis marcescibilis]